MTRKPMPPQFVARFDPPFLDAHPKKSEFMALIGECIALYSQVDARMATILGVVLRSDSEATAVAYHELRNSGVRRTVLKAAAPITLGVGSDQLKLYQASIGALLQLQDERDALAHGMFGAIDNQPELIAWVQAAIFSRQQSLIAANSRAGRPHDWKALETMVRDSAFTYSLQDLAALRDEMRAMTDTMNHLIGYLHYDQRPAGERKALYDEVAASPRIADALKKL